MVKQLDEGKSFDVVVTEARGKQVAGPGADAGGSGGTAVRELEGQGQERGRAGRDSPESGDSALARGRHGRVPAAAGSAAGAAAEVGLQPFADGWIYGPRARGRSRPFVFPSWSAGRKERGLVGQRSVLPHHSDDDALHLHAVGVENHRLRRGIVGLQADPVVLLVEGPYGRLRSVDQREHRLAVLGRRAVLDDDEVAFAATSRRAGQLRYPDFARARRRPPSVALIGFARAGRMPRCSRAAMRAA